MKLQQIALPAPRRPAVAKAGFTLLELLVVLVIVSILAAVAYPSYLQSVKRGYRSEARMALLESQQFMARFYATNSRYTLDEAGSLSPTLPQRLQMVPADSPRYRLSLSATLNSFTLTATPTGSDDCGNLTLSHTGVKGRSGSEVSVAECWR